MGASNSKNKQKLLKIKIKQSNSNAAFQNKRGSKSKVEYKNDNNVIAWNPKHMKIMKKDNKLETDEKRTILPQFTKTKKYQNAVKSDEQQIPSSYSSLDKRQQIQRIYLGKVVNGLEDNLHNNRRQNSEVRRSHKSLESQDLLKNEANSQNMHTNALLYKKSKNNSNTYLPLNLKFKSKRSSRNSNNSNSGDVSSKNTIALSNAKLNSKSNKNINLDTKDQRPSLNLNSKILNKLNLKTNSTDFGLKRDPSSNKMYETRSIFGSTRGRFNSKFKPNQVIKDELETVHKEESLNLNHSDREDSPKRNDSSSSDEFGDQAKMYIRKHVKTILDKENSRQVSSTRNLSNGVKSGNHKQIDSTTFESQNSINSINKTSNNGIASKDNLFKLLYSKNYELHFGPNKFKKSKGNRLLAQILSPNKAKNQVLPKIENGSTSARNNLLPTVYEGSYSQNKKPSFLNANTKPKRHVPPKRLSSLELLTLGSSKVPTVNEKGLITSIMTPSEINHQGKKDRFVGDFVGSTRVNQNGLLGALIKELKKEHKMPI